MEYMELAIKMGELMGLEIAIQILECAPRDSSSHTIRVIYDRVIGEIEKLKTAS